MSQLFDDISRIVGSPIPRRRAIKAIGGAVVGAFLGASVFRRLGSAQTPTRCCRGSGGACILPAPLPCPRELVTQERCAALGGEWRAGHSCCPDGRTCPQGETCCGATCCDSNSSCFAGEECCPTTQLCGSFTVVCCPDGTVCVPDTQECCPVAQFCPGSQTCCPNGTTCINNMCCPTERVCTDPMTNQRICCSSGRCCGGTKCCPGGVCSSDGLNCKSIVVVSPSR